MGVEQNLAQKLIAFDKSSQRKKDLLEKSIFVQPIRNSTEREVREKRLYLLGQEIVNGFERDLVSRLKIAGRK